MPEASREPYRTHDGQVIYVSYRGILNIPPEIWERINQGEDVPSSEYYFRSQPMFETAVNTPYSWLNNILAVGVGTLRGMGIDYEVFQVL